MVGVRGRASAPVRQGAGCWGPGLREPAWLSFAGVSLAGSVARPPSPRPLPPVRLQAVRLKPKVKAHQTRINSTPGMSA